MWALLSQGGALRAYPELLTDESLRLSFFFDDVVLITAWRTTCLYGVSYSCASPMHSDDDIFISSLLYHSHVSPMHFYLTITDGEMK